MSDMTVHEFCNTHSACKDGRAWAMENCTSMQDAWEKLKPEWLIWVATRNGVLTERELRLFAVWCARQVQHLMADPRSVDAIDVAERHANGNATDAELAAARAAAGAAARAAAGAAAGAAAMDAARTAAMAAARAAARTAAMDAAGAAAMDAAWTAAMDAAGAAAWTAARAMAAAGAAAGAVAGAAAGAAARAAQAEWLRKNCKPNFIKEVKP